MVKPDESAPTCPYCGYLMLICDKYSRYRLHWDPQLHITTSKRNRMYYARCHHCNARGPLVQTYEGAINECRRHK